MVSVVVPFYNAEPFLAEAIESVVAQSYADWELLLIDDGSTDRSPAIAHEFERADRRMRYVRGASTNRGTAATRNVGLRLARGELIALLDADDVWFPEKLEEQVTLLTAKPEAALLFGQTEYWSSWAGETSGAGDFVADLGVEPGRVFEPPELLVRLYPLGSGAAPTPSSIVFRRSLLDVIGGFEEGMTNAYEDQCFLAKVYEAAPVLVVDRVWDRYRQHRASVSAQVEPLDEYWALRLAFLRWLKDYLAHRPEVDERVSRSLGAALFLAGDVASPKPPVTVVEEVTIQPGPQLAGANLELPSVGRLAVCDPPIAGWAVGHSRPVRLVRVEQESRVLSEFAVDRPRPDLDASAYATFASRAGFNGSVDGFALKPGELRVSVVLGDGTVETLAIVKLR